MLNPAEFSAGRLRDAKPMTLLLPASHNGQAALVVSAGENRLHAVVLDKQHEFMVFDCTTKNAWQGMLVHPVSIEVDETSLFDLNRFDPPLGALTRKGDTLSVAARNDQGLRVSRRVALITGLPPGHDDVEIGFTRWNIVVGHGTEKRVLYSLERPEPKDD